MILFNTNIEGMMLMSAVHLSCICCIYCYVYYVLFFFIVAAQLNIHKPFGKLLNITKVSGMRMEMFVLAWSCKD